MGSGDLVGGRYPLTYPMAKLFGLASNATQVNIPPRSNLEWAWANDLTDQSASLVSGILTLVPVPVETGDVISKVSILAGAHAEHAGLHNWGALYSGVLTTIKLLAQSTDNTGATLVAASARHDFTLATPQVITPTNAPYGYVYAGVMCAVKPTSGTTGTTATALVPSLVSTAVATAVQYAYFTDAPPFFGGKFGSALTTTASATLTLATVTKLATPPVVILT